MHDRDYYRSLSDEALLAMFREHGTNPEMAIAMAERLEDALHDHPNDRSDM